MATAATQTQEQNRRYAKLANALDAARDQLDKVIGQLGIARRNKKVLRMAELEVELSEAKDAFNKAVRDCESIGISIPLSTEPQAKPGTVAALRATNPEFRQIDDEVARFEREHDRLLAQIGPLIAALEKERATFSFSVTPNPLADAVLQTIYPDVRPDSGGVLKNKNIAHMSLDLANLTEQFNKTEAERAEATVKRDAMLAALRGKSELKEHTSR